MDIMLALLKNRDLIVVVFSRCCYKWKLDHGKAIHPNHKRRTGSKHPVSENSNHHESLSVCIRPSWHERYVTLRISSLHRFIDEHQAC
jgi:hypothetical protein